VSEPLVRAEGVSVAYRQGDGWLTVLHAVSFTIAPGETFGLVGESGCGKSTMAYQLLGYRHPSSKVEGGRLLYRGDDLLRLDRSALDRLRGNRISLVPQNPTTALSPGMRVGEQVVEVLLGHGASPGRAAAAGRAAELFGLVGLPEPAAVGRRYPHQLSGGQQQRVAIAMALACRPDLLVLDEPTTGLDVTTQKQILDLLRALRARLGMAMLYVTHDLGVLAEIADRVGVMYAGHMVEIAPAATLFTQPLHPYTRGLIASRPQLDDSARLPARALRGLLSRQELPPGCPFAPRCDHAEPSCAANRQRLDPVAPGHDVACQRWRALAAPALVAADARTARTATEAERPLLRLEQVAIGYGGKGGWLGLGGSAPAPVVSGLDLGIAPGETLALVGESGSGKSTIARAISGLLRPLAGRILFRDQPLAGRVAARPAEQRRQIQYVFQNPDASLNPRMRVGATLARPLQVFGRARGASARERVAAALDDVRLDAGYAARYPDQLSGGERQRVAIARALIAEPLLLLCDEVLSALDVSVQASVIELLQRLRREHHLAMLFISHDLAVVRSLADRVGVLFGGQLVELGSAAAIFAPPFHPYTYTLLLAVPGLTLDSPAEPAPAAPGPGAPPGRGCVFSGRCPWKLGPVCDSEPPPWQAAGADLAIRCHIPAPELSARARARLAALPPELPAASRQR
jgi:peptide/nickel transport system ATP-binding protein